MGITFLSPLAGLVVLAALLPVGAFVAGERRVAVVRRVLRLRAPEGRRRFVAPAAAVAVVGLLALAAAQPVRSERHTTTVRSDAEVFVVVDSSKSMLAASSPGAPTRFDRAVAGALELRRELPELKVGLASLTDRLLPHLFPSRDVADYGATLRDAMGVDRPPPLHKGTGTTTSLQSLGALGRAGYFAPGSIRRVAVVITDGESVPPSSGRMRSQLSAGHVGLVFLQVWRPRERVYTPSGPDPAYREEPDARDALRNLGVVLDAPVLEEGRTGAAASRVRALVGDGPRVEIPTHSTIRPLSPYVALAAILPLGIVLRRRNL
jgi:hypothetical protein